MVWLFKLKDANAKLERWRIRLQEHNCSIIYKKGRLNTNADALSRIELKDIAKIEDQDSIDLNALETESVIANIDDTDYQRAL